jgi:hypothetical protein
MANPRHQAADRLAAGLGWFSIGLGLAELLMPSTLGRALGMKRREGLIRLYGLREIANGLAILGASNRAPWVWTRVAGDAVDIATLAGEYRGSSRRRRNVAIALGAVAGVTAVDIVCARALDGSARRVSLHDYSGRSGWPMGIEAVRGIARKDFEMPRDMRIVPAALKPASTRR